MELKKANRQNALVNCRLWVQMKDHPDYEIHPRGVVRRIRDGYIVKNTEYLRGYLFVALSDGQRFKNYSLHRLVAKAFHPNPENKPQVNHKDGIKTNPRAANLEWNTSSENMKHAFRLGLVRHNRPQVGRFGSLSPVATPILQFDLNGVFLNEYGAVIEASRATGVKSPSIVRAARGFRNHSGGFIWSYKSNS